MGDGIFNLLGILVALLDFRSTVLVGWRSTGGPRIGFEHWGQPVIVDLTSAGPLTEALALVA